METGHLNDDLKNIEIHCPAGLKLEYDAFSDDFKTTFNAQQLKQRSVWKLKDGTWKFESLP